MDPTLNSFVEGLRQQQQELSDSAHEDDVISAASDGDVIMPDTNLDKGTTVTPFILHEPSSSSSTASSPAISPLGASPPPEAVDDVLPEVSSRPGELCSC